jgi:hypothetical protein
MSLLFLNVNFLENQRFSLGIQKQVTFELNKYPS